MPKLLKNHIINAAVALLTLFLYSIGFSATLQCHQLFNKTLSQPYQEKFIATENSTNILHKLYKLTTSNPTSRRKETKNTLLTSTYQKIRDELQLNLAKEGITIGVRDAVKKGFRNVTKTEYTRQIKFPKNFAQKFGLNVENDVSGVFRKRKYGLVPQTAQVHPNSMLISEFTQDYSFYEFKFKDPDFENSILKPRAYMKDTTFDRLTTQKITSTELQEMISDTLSLKPNQSLSREEVVTFIEFILSFKKSDFNFEFVLETFYERLSEFVRFMNSKSHQIFEIQITQDSFISASRKNIVGNYEPVVAHNADMLVIETKTPVDQSKIQLPSAKDDFANQKKTIQTLQEIPGFNYYLEFQNALTTQHVSSALVNNQVVIYQANKGKKGLLKSVDVLSDLN